MKKHRLYAVLAAMGMAMAFVLAGCQQPSSGGDSGNIGDIVLTDGTFVTAASFTDEMKDKAAAVIVRAKSEDKPALGVGIKHSKSGLAWCTESAVGYSTNITELQGLKEEGYMDGSDGWEKLKAACNDAVEHPEYYPAWNFCNTYAKENSLEGNLATGWYLPTMAELYTIYKNKDLVDTSLNKAGGSQFGDNLYWSSSQSASYDDYAYILIFYDGDWGTCYKNGDFYYVCAVRAFN